MEIQRFFKDLAVEDKSNLFARMDISNKKEMIV